MPMSLRAKPPKRPDSPFSGHRSKRVKTNDVVMHHGLITPEENEKKSLGHSKINGLRLHEDYSASEDTSLRSPLSRRLAPKPDVRLEGASTNISLLGNRLGTASSKAVYKSLDPTEQAPPPDGGWAVAEHIGGHINAYSPPSNSHNGVSEKTIGARRKERKGTPATVLSLPVEESNTFPTGKPDLPALSPESFSSSLDSALRNGTSNQTAKEAVQQMQSQHGSRSRSRPQSHVRTTNSSLSLDRRQKSLPHTYTFMVSTTNTKPSNDRGHVNPSTTSTNKIDLSEVESLITDSDSSQDSSPPETPTINPGKRSPKGKQKEQGKPLSSLANSDVALHHSIPRPMPNQNEAQSETIIALSSASAVLAEMAQGGGWYVTPYAHGPLNQNYQPHPGSFNVGASPFANQTSKAYVTPYANPSGPREAMNPEPEVSLKNPDKLPEPTPPQAENLREEPEITTKGSLTVSIDCEPSTARDEKDLDTGTEPTPLTESALDGLLALANGGRSLSAETSEESDDDDADRTITRSVTPEDETDGAVESIMEGIIAELMTNCNHGHGLSFLAPHISYHQSANRQRFATTLQTCVIDASPIANVIISKEQSRATSELYKHLEKRITPLQAQSHPKLGYGTSFSPVGYGTHWMPQTVIPYRGTPGYPANPNYYYYPPPPPTLPLHSAQPHFLPPPMHQILPSQPGPVQPPPPFSSKYSSRPSALPSKFRSNTVQGRKLDEAYGFPRLTGSRKGRKRKRV